MGWVVLRVPLDPLDLFWTLFQVYKSSCVFLKHIIIEMQSDSSDSPGFGGLGSSGSGESSPGFGGGSPNFGGTGESSPGFGGGSPNFGGTGESSPGFGGGSPNFGGPGSPNFGGGQSPGRLLESPRNQVQDSVVIIDDVLPVEGSLEDVPHLSARMSSLEISDYIPPFSWKGIVGPVEEESRASLRFFDGTLRDFNRLVNMASFSQTCEVVPSSGPMDTRILALRKGPIYVELTTVKDTIASSIRTYVWAQVFVAPVSAMRELLLEADSNALQNPSMDDPTTLRGTCLDIPDIPVQMHRHCKVVDDQVVTGVQLWLPPTFFGNGLDKFLAYVLRA